MNDHRDLDLDRPRSVGEMLTGAFALYRRVPILFLAFAAIVVVPYELIVLAATGAGPLAQGHLGFLGSKGLLIADSFIVTPLISALHVHAVREVGAGRRPTFGATFRQSLPRLPVVAVAAGISGVAIGLGTLAFAIPGILLLAIWPVVAQAAALESGGPIDALRRSFNLTRGYRWHGIGLFFAATLTAGIPWLVLFLSVGHTTTNAGTFVAGTAVQIVLRSFTALATGLLYFDLVARSRYGPPAPGDAGEPTEAMATVAANGHPLDPNSWSDEDRPAGWYVNPLSPNRMRYWMTNGPGTGVWSGRSTKTPGPVQHEWEKLRQDAEVAD
ncbi:MAG TPA: hypothetical protein VJ204_13745 [Solirubrobacterales bacterium]|nr:hypothetical protein [Solirubrobacterales bacterium]